MNFWKEIDKPIIALAPMEDVTDTVFRQILLTISKPGVLKVVCAEFTSTDGLCHPVGKDRVSHRLFVSPGERKLLKEQNVRIVAQIWGGNPENFRKATEMLCRDYDFDGIDINMGCPIKNIVRQAACSDLIKHPALAQEIVLAVKESTKLPVSVKTRTGIREHNTEQWIGTLLAVKPDALIIHGRTQKMMYAYPADWNEIEKAVKARDASGLDIPVIGNGDVHSYSEACEKTERYGVDGVMIGRGINRNPWMFNPDKPEPSKEERLAVLLKHSELFERTWGREKNYSIIKKFFKMYTSGFHGASEARVKLMKSGSHEETEKIIMEL